MRSALRKELEPVGASFLVRRLEEPHFDPNWHFHPHYQLFLVEAGTGTRFIGDSTRPFGEGDLVFLGPNLPHLWRSDKAYFEKGSDLRTTGIVVYFQADFLGEAFLEKPEMHRIRQLLLQARRGLEWTGSTRERTRQTLVQLADLPTGFSGLMSLLQLLDELAGASDRRYITSLGYTNTTKPAEADRMRRVHDYVLDHFQEPIRLEAVADRVGMTPAAFCRYFKARANKTFSQFVAEVRIGHACKLLMEGRGNVTQVSLESGYRTLSNFNRQFSEITGYTPTQYIRTYQKI